MKKLPIGVELYTVREAFAENPEDTFKKLKAYLEPAFLRNILENYVRKDFLA